MSASSTRAVSGSPHLSRSFGRALAGNVLYSACLWALMLVLVRLGSMKLVGLYAYGSALCLPILAFTNLNLRAVQATDARNEYSFADYFGLRLPTTALAFLAAMAAITALRPASELVVLAMVVVVKCTEAVIEVLYGALQREERMGTISLSMSLRGVAYLAVAGASLLATKSAVVCFGAMAGVALLFLLGYDLRATGAVLQTKREPRLRRVRPSFGLRTQASLARLSFPLAITMTLLMLNSSIPRYLIESAFGYRELGIFAAIAWLVQIGDKVAIALGQAASPKLANRYAAGDLRGYRRLVAALVGFGVCLGVVGIVLTWLLGRPVLAIAYGEEYGGHTDLLLWLVVAGSVSWIGSGLGYALTAARAFKSNAYGHIANTFVLLLGPPLFLQHPGLVTVAKLAAVGNAAACVLFAAVVLRVAFSAGGRAVPRAIDVTPDTRAAGSERGAV